MTIPEIFIELRKNTGLTQSKFAKLVGVSQHCIGSIELGKRKPRLQTAWKVVKALGLSLDIFNDAKS